MLACTAAAIGLASAPTASAHSSNDGRPGLGHSLDARTLASENERHGHPGGPRTKTLTTSVVLPFQLAVSGDRVYVTDGMPASLSVVRHGKSTTLVTAPEGSDIAGVDVADHGHTIAWGTSNADHSTTTLTIRRAGRPDVVADLSGYEARVNPDRHQTYGIVAGGNPCAAGILGNLTGGAATYTGAIDSHPYSVTRIHGGWAVADAGANAILRVSDRGAVSTIAVLPPQPVTLTSGMVSGLEGSFGVPAGSFSCLVGVTYAFEAVPTDVETGHHGRLVVSTLPGGPEDPSLGARGSVYSVDMASGHSKRLATGFLGATNVAVGEDDSIYVTEFFGGKVDRIRHGHVRTVLTGGAPLSLEARGDSLYVGYAGQVDFQTGAVLSHGSIQRVRL